MNNLTMDAENQTFTLSLEDVDIDLLPNYFKKKEKVMPIWSTSNLGSRQGSYYEFQVLAGRGDDDEAEEIKMVPCHICNIDIPLIYLKQHRNSTKHKICTQIADQALERTKKQMYEHFECETKHSNSTYYCESCALAINRKDKETHEKTKEHSNSMRYDRLLNELLMLYNENTIQGLKECITTGNKVDASTNTEILEEDIEATEMSEYIPEICPNKTDYSITAMDDNSIDININGKRVNVSVDNFHGFFSMGEKVLCMLCAKEVTDEKTHKGSKGHVEKVMAPLKNEHCIREIGSYKHCVICNKYVDSYHFNDAEHRSQLNKAITNGSEEINEPQNYCELCDMILPIGQTPDSLAHTKSPDHRQFLWQANPNLHHHLKKTEDPTVSECRICYLPVKNNDMHLESKIHMTRYKALLEINKIKEVDDLRIFCQVCCNRMLGINVLTHIGGKKHLKSLEDYKTTGQISDSLFSQELERQTNFKTDLIETEHEYLLNTDGVLNFVIDESNGVTDEETSMIYNLLTEESEESNLFNLKVTDGNLIMVLSNTDEDLDDIKDVMKRKNKILIKKPPADLTKVYYLMERTDKLDILLCKVCQITVPNTVEDINEHNKSSDHNQSFFKCIDVAMSLVKKNKKKKENADCDDGIQIDSKQSSDNSESKLPRSLLQSSSHFEISKSSGSFSITPLRGSSSESNPPGSNSHLNQPSSSQLNLFGSNSQLNQPSSSQLNLFGSNSQLNQPSSSQLNLFGSNSQLNQPSSSQLNLFGSNSQLNRPSSSQSNPPGSNSSSSKVAIESNVKGLTVKNGKEDNIFCDICLISVPNEDACLKRHYEGSAHKYHAQNSLQINSVVGLPTHSFHLLTKTQNPKELFCNACNAKVPYLPQNTSEHLKGANHEMNYKAMLEKNKLTKVDAITFFCGYCNINVVFSKIIDHITKGYHSLFVKSDIQFQHVAKPVEKPINANPTVQKPFHFCVICNVKVPNSDHDINIHEKGRPHLENMKLRILKLEKSSQDDLKQNYQMEFKKTGELHCKVCKVNVPSGNSCANIHLNGAPHKNAYNKLLATHKITKVGSKLHCQNCKVFLKLSTELTHIEDMNHLVNTLANNGLVVDGGNNSASNASQALPARRTRIRKNKNN